MPEKLYIGADEVYWHYVGCECSTEGPHTTDQDSAILAWNTRAAPEGYGQCVVDLQAEVEQLRNQVATARELIDRAITEIMEPAQVGRWGGVRAWQELDTSDYRVPPDYEQCVQDLRDVIDEQRDDIVDAARENQELKERCANLQRVNDGLSRELRACRG